MEYDGDIRWFDPDPRAILPLDGFHLSRRLARTIKRKPYEIRRNSAFEAVIAACASPDREGTWIDERIMSAYIRLHQLGFAHSVEAWRGDELVGGLYGVAVRGLFAGESMFSYATDASKICLAHLVEHLNQQGFVLLDTQFSTDHLAQFGVVDITRDEYKQLLAAAIEVDVVF